MARPGTKHIYTLKEGETCAVAPNGFVVAHPDRQPFIVDGSGKHEIIGVDWPSRTIPLSTKRSTTD